MADPIVHSGEQTCAAYHPARRARWRYVLPLAIYLVGLTHQINEPWVGMHDWNGAFFSQLARNFLRYPWEIHHGMPIVAVGEAVPPPAERSIYATHPPGLVWLVALAFRLFGEHEWAARLVPITASVASLGLLMFLVGRRWGGESALVTGLIYAAMPMSVYYGRMVNHEAVCLFGMLAMSAAWAVVTEPGTGSASRRWAIAAFVAALFGLVWVDWSGGLFAGLFVLYVVIKRRRGVVRTWCPAFALVTTVVAIASMMIYLVHAGLGGRGGDLIAIFASRAARPDHPLTSDAWEYVPENLSWAVVVLGAVGVLMAVSRSRHSAVEGEGSPVDRGGQTAAGGTPGPQRMPARTPGCGDQTAGLGVLAVTGLIWLVVFWRQFSIHGYWAFYLGPIVAWLASRSLLGLRDFLARRWRVVAATGLVYLLLVGVMAGEMRSVLSLYTACWYGGESEMQAWQEIHRRTQPDDRVLLFDDPIRIERHGGYEFRNLAPPQMAYYLDRAFDVERNFREVPSRAAEHACYVIPIVHAGTTAAELEPLRARFRVDQIRTKLVFDLGSAATSRSPLTDPIGP